MRTKVNKIFLMITILMLLFSVNTKVYAWGDIISDGDQFINEGKQGGVEIDTEDLQDLSGFLYNALLSAGVVIAVIVATVLGIQFMMGGAEGQAKVKEMLIPFVVGCIIVFGGFGIWKLALSIGNQLEPAYTPTGSLDGAREKQYEDYKAIEDNTYDFSSKTDGEVKSLYSSNYIYDDLKRMTQGDPRAGNNQTIYTLEEAIQRLSSYKQKIYNETKSRNLLKSDGYTLK